MTEDVFPKTHGHDHPGDPEYRFCPVCGHPFHREVIKLPEPERLVCSHCGFVFYLDPKVAVGTLCTLEIPWGELAFPSTRDALQDYVEKHQRRISSET